MDDHGEGAEARTRLRQQLVSRRTLASIHGWPVMLCAAVCGISVVCLWRCEMRVWGVGRGRIRGAGGGGSEEMGEGVKGAEGQDGSGVL